MVQEDQRKVAYHRGTRFYLKPNGLPEGYGLFWIDKEHQYIGCKVHGQRFACGTGDWKTAVDFADAKHAEYDKRTKGVNVEDVKVGELLDDLLRHYHDRATKRGAYAPRTEYNAKCQMNMKGGIRDTFGNLKVSKLKPTMYTDYWRKWESEYEKRGKKIETAEVQNTIRHHLRTLGRALTLGMENYKVPKDTPLPKPGKDADSNRNNCITFDQLDVLISDKGLPDYLKPVLVTCFFTGFRKKESTFIHRTQANWTERIITARALETKSGKEKPGTIPAKYWPVVMEWEERTRRDFPKVEWLFHLDGKQLTTADIDKQFNATCERLGWHVVMKDEEGNPIRRKNRTPKIDRSACRWHDARRTATTTISNLENLTDVDRRSTLGISPETQARYDKTNHAIKVRDALDRKFPVAPAPEPQAAPKPATNGNGNGADKTAKLQELKAWFDDGLIDADEYKAKKARILDS